MQIKSLYYTKYFLKHKLILYTGEFLTFDTFKCPKRDLFNLRILETIYMEKKNICINTLEKIIKINII